MLGSKTLLIVSGGSRGGAWGPRPGGPGTPLRRKASRASNTKRPPLAQGLDLPPVVASGRSRPGAKGERGEGGKGSFDLLALLAFLPFIISSCFTQIRGVPSPRSTTGGLFRDILPLMNKSSGSFCRPQACLLKSPYLPYVY